MIQIRSLLVYTLLSLLASSLNGCALVQRVYVPPAGGEIAHFRALSSSGLPFTGPIATFSEAKDCRGRYFIHNPPGEVANTPISAGTPFSVAFHQPLGGSFSTGFSYCVPIITFNPVSGRTYTTRVWILKNGCSVTLEASDSLTNENRRVEPFEVKEFSNGFDENSSFCNSKN